MKPARLLNTALTAAALAATSVSAHAITLASRYTPLGGTQWRVELALTADATLPGISEFTVYFAQPLRANVIPTFTPSTWSVFAAQPDAGLPADGFVDYLVNVGTPALSAGQTQGGFNVSFTYLGAGSPGPLRYEIVDPVSFAVLASGLSVVTAVPEPSSTAMALVGAALLAAALRRRATSAA